METRTLKRKRRREREGSHEPKKVPDVHRVDRRPLETHKPIAA